MLSSDNLVKNSKLIIFIHHFIFRPEICTKQISMGFFGEVYVLPIHPRCTFLWSYTDDSVKVLESNL